MRRFRSKVEAILVRSSLENDRTQSPYTFNVATTSTHNLSGRDFVRQPNETESSFTNTLGVAGTSEVASPSPNYIYYRIYAEDGAIPSKAPVTPGDPFLGRIKARSVPPPRTIKSVKCSIAKAENIKDREDTSLFLAPYSQSPMHDAEKVTIPSHAGPGSTPQKPLALVAKMSDSERSDLESRGRGHGGLASTVAEPDTTPPEIRYLYYLLYADDYEIPSRVSIDPEEPSLGRIRADSVAPPHNPTSIKRCIARVEKNPELANGYLFADTSCDTPLKEGHLSILRTDGPGSSPNMPMAIVQVKTPSIPDGKYLIKNQITNTYWSTYHNPITKVHFYPNITLEVASSKVNSFLHWDITHDTNGNIFMTSPYAPSSWVGAEIAGSAVPVPWRLILADAKSYYLTTDKNRVSQKTRVPAARLIRDSVGPVPGTMATLKEGDPRQMWEFIRI